ncbi:MAG: hypothetical protein ACI81G_001977 [Gammaproteobacteria bacterium]
MSFFCAFIQVKPRGIGAFKMEGVSIGHWIDQIKKTQRTSSL